MRVGTGVETDRGQDRSRISEAGTDVAGYSILQASNIDAAMKLLDGHPHLQMPGAAVKVYETLGNREADRR